MMKHSGAIQEADSRNSQYEGVRLSPAVNLTFDLQIFSSSSSLLRFHVGLFFPPVSSLQRLSTSHLVAGKAELVTVRWVTAV